MKPETWAGLRIALYARYSSDHQRETSLEDQARRAEQLVTSRGGRIDPTLRFMDAARSGATIHRPEFQRLMNAVEDGHVDMVVAEDVSRLSRDLGDAAHILKRIRHHGAMLVSIADGGVDFANEESFTLFGMKAIISQVYLTDLRYKTKRGLEGRMLAGKSTGGRLFGYRTEVEKGPSGDVIGARIVVEPEEAKIVRRIFEMSGSGHSLLSIARALNVEGAPVLRPSKKNRKKGWVASTVRAILHNETYVGKRSYMKREWFRDQDTGKRRYKLRTNGVMMQEQPELRIIDDDLWKAVQSRLAAVRVKYTPTPKRPSPKATGAAGRVTSYPFSGLLICAHCQTPMVICGGSPHRYYRCGDVMKRGICTNRLPVQERRVRSALLTALTEHIASPRAIHYLRKKWAEAVGDGARRNEEELQKARTRLARCEQRLRNYIEMWADGIRDPEVKTAWDDAKAEKASVRDQITTLEAATFEPLRLPTPYEVEDTILNLHKLAEKAPVEAREVLGRMFGDGKIQMHPQADGSYLAKAQLLPLVLIVGHKRRNPHPAEQSESVYISSCAGRI
ncbi:MAG: recombinase family protein [Polyangiaceae bacterium]|nr:recombinase family protein [Polyangiaceae bacterium]